jgi:uracil-DNA glycosylase
MGELSEEILACKGYDNCFGKAAGEIKPIVFRMDPTMRIMVITEQPRAGRRKESRRKEPKEALKEAFQVKKSVPYRLKHLLGDSFQTSVESESGIFYWTHYIKCPGEFRRIKCKMDACADAHLQREIEFIKPSLIICVGGRSSSWLLNKFYRNEKDWREVLWRQIFGNILEIKLADSVTKLFFLFHPSERSGIGWFIDQKLKNSLQKLISGIS